MIGRIGVTAGALVLLAACGLVLLAATGVAAQQYVPVENAAAPISGTVVRIDPPSMVVLSDGRVIPLNADSVVTVGGMRVTELTAGESVVIYPTGPYPEYPSRRKTP